LKALGANLDELPKTKTGDPSTSKDALRQLTGPQETLEWVETYLLNYSALQKQENDFVNTYADLIKDGVIRGSYTKTVATGRLSCRKPNLQQVPSRGELQTKDGMRVRSIFRAPDGQTFIVADFAQVELLLAATIAGEDAMLDIFREGGDIHRETAAWVLGKPKSKVTKTERTLAKALNFGLIYGCSAKRLLESATNGYGVEDLNLKKAKQYRKAFFKKYPALKRWHEKVERDCNQGVAHTHTPFGRRRKLPYWKDSTTPAHTVAKNAPVQGAGADAIKLTLTKLFEDRHSCPGNPQLRCSVHDEVVLTVDDEHKDTAIEWVARHMADAEREVVGDPESPIAVDVEVRKHW
jgi:DNA polymerase-1